MAQTVSTSFSTGSRGNGLPGRCGAGCDQANQQRAGPQGSLQMGIMGGAQPRQALGQAGKHNAPPGDGHRGTLPKAQGEQEKQSWREVTAASKGNELLGQQAILRLARCPPLPSRWAGAAQRCSFWSCGY